MKKPKVFVLFAVLMLLVGFAAVLVVKQSGDYSTRYSTRDYIEYPWEKGLCPTNEDNVITVQQWAIIMPHLPQWLPDYMRTYDSACKYWLDNYRDKSVFTLTAWHNRNDSDKFVFALKEINRFECL